MNITCKVVKNELSVDMHVSRYAKIVEELRLEVTSWLALSDNHLVKKSSPFVQSIGERNSEMIFSSCIIFMRHNSSPYLEQGCH